MVRKSVAPSSASLPGAWGAPRSRMAMAYGAARSRSGISVWPWDAWWSRALPRANLYVRALRPIRIASRQDARADGSAA
ncbi:hypothetical protein ADK70_03615 [Streptomyces rimosus subsp. pseudoverticillatus]|nr:hypothetical protein ADK70_03615 [Streptomyces rimosus subsp. pseudoverticillatus]